MEKSKLLYGSPIIHDNWILVALLSCRSWSKLQQLHDPKTSNHTHAFPSVAIYSSHKLFVSQQYWHYTPYSARMSHAPLLSPTLQLKSKLIIWPPQALCWRINQYFLASVVELNSWVQHVGASPWSWVHPPGRSMGALPLCAVEQINNLVYRGNVRYSTRLPSTKSHLDKGSLRMRLQKLDFSAALGKR